MWFKVEYSGNNYSERFLAQAEKQINQFANSFIIPGMIPEEIAQELRLHLWSKLSLYNPKKGNIAGWTYVVCKHKLTDLQPRSNSQKSRKKQDLINLGSKRIKSYKEDKGD